MSARRQAFTVLSVRRKELKGRGEESCNIKRWESKCNPIIVVHVILLKHRIIVNVNEVLSPDLVPQS